MPGLPGHVFSVQSGRGVGCHMHDLGCIMHSTALTQCVLHCVRGAQEWKQKGWDFSNFINAGVYAVRSNKRTIRYFSMVVP